MNQFFKRLFCWHDWEKLGPPQFGWLVKYTWKCSKCDKEIISDYPTQ